MLRKKDMPYSQLTTEKHAVPPVPVVGSLYPIHLRDDGGAVDWRRGLATALFYSGALRLAATILGIRKLELSRGTMSLRLQRITSPKLLILCYHRVGLGGVPLYSQLAPALFEAQMRYLRKHYRLVSLEEGFHALQESQACGPMVAVTFDDGYRDIYTHAFPVLRKYEIPATVYLIAESMETGVVGWYDRIFLALQVFPATQIEVELDRRETFQLTSSKTRFRAALEIVSRLRTLSNGRRRQICQELETRISLQPEHLRNKILTWQQVAAMQDAGVTFGSHTMSHPVVSQLAETEMKRELADAKKLLEMKLGRTVNDFAFPFGHFEDCGAAATNLLANTGYRSGVTTVPGVNTNKTNPFALRRVQVDESHNLAQFALLLNQHLLFADSLFQEAPISKPAVIELTSRQAPFSASQGTRNA